MPKGEELSTHQIGSVPLKPITRRTTMVPQANYRRLASCVLCFAGLFGLGASSAAAVTLEWVRQLGTLSHDSTLGVSTDGLGNAYITGETGGSLAAPFAGNADGYLIKYDSLGNVVWARQWGTPSVESGYNVSADRLGNVFVAGTSHGNLSGPQAGNGDVFVSRFNAAGDLIWTRQFGSSEFDISYAVSADGLGNVYLSGETLGDLQGPNAGSSDMFVSKYDELGNLQWTRQLGTTGTDRGLGVSADSLGNVFFSGFTAGSLAGMNAGPPFSDAFVGKYDADGNLQWLRQLGTNGDDEAGGLSVDGVGNAFVSGRTTGTLGGPRAGGYDAFLSKYDATGSLQWVRQLGTPSRDVGLDASIDGLGNVYLSGETQGSLEGSNAGFEDAFVSKYDEFGNHLWTRQLGSSQYEGGFGISADRLGNIFIAGRTTGDLGGLTYGDSDGFVAKYLIPEPTTIALLGIGIAWIIVRTTRCSITYRRYKRSWGSVLQVAQPLPG
jgi:hypothetical protein